MVDPDMNRSYPNTPVEPNLFIERRSAQDRRKKRLNLFRRPFSPRRRRTLRRQVDQRGFYLLDYYNPKIFYVVTLILLLSVMDALLTLWLIGVGAEELNPVMAYFLGIGPNMFMLAKYLITSASVVTVVLLNYVFIQRIRLQLGDLLKYFAGCFAAVVVWELVLIVRFAL
jgi:hypothetical protein